jgi:hypothetical protein
VTREPRRDRTRTASRRPPGRRPRSIGRLTADQAFIALFIAAMDASGHISSEELARAHHLIWSMRRFRNRPADRVGREIERMRILIGDHGADPVIDAAAGRIPARLRRAAYAVAADLVLVDGRMVGGERRFLDRLAADLRLAPETARQIVDVMLAKNSA